ncbi:hypothetical protein J3Q64DRAFT_1771213 [Phycomyces blakesleeanus]|uniref:Uncharacterized protein n=1 Tax=Phycomyces blakesleeanus TaxID=4837 RepID=A0ABR3AMG6_PHYBL
MLVKTLSLFALGSVTLNLAYAAPLLQQQQSLDGSKRLKAQNTQKCFELTYPLNGTVWNIDGDDGHSHDITWKVVGDCRPENYINIIPVIQDTEDGLVSLGLGDPQYTSQLLDIQSGRARISLDDLEGEGRYVFVIGPLSEDWSDYADLAYVDVYE